MDARSLLRAKKAEARIEHPYAAYNASGQLRCSVCAVPVKQWDAHLLTKQHRTSVAREKAQAQAAAEAQARSKRPAEDADVGGTKRARVGEKSAAGPQGLPAGFFSSGKRVVEDEQDDEEGDDGEAEVAAGPFTAPPRSALAAPILPAPPGQPAPSDPPAKTGDSELDDFLASLAEPQPGPDGADLSTLNPSVGSSAAAQPARRRAGYKDLIPGQASYEAAPVRNVPQEEEQAVEAEEEESEADRRARVAREEREEIMGRLEEEERAQEDADGRVAFLKQRMEALRRKREGKGGVVGAGGAGAAVKRVKATKVDGS